MRNMIVADLHAGKGISVIDLSLAGDRRTQKGY